MANVDSNVGRKQNESSHMHTVFVSSTYLDLQPERSAVREAILRLQCRFVGMEYFGSDPERPLRVSLDLMRDATVYIGIIAHRYGTVDADTGKSITQLEYESARAHGIPTLIYLKDPLSLVEPTSQYIDFDACSIGRLAKFKGALQSDCVVQWFSSPDDLAAKITADIAKILLSTRPVGRFQHDLSDGPQIMPGEKGVRRIYMVGPVAVGKTVYGCMLLHEPVGTLFLRGLALEVGRNDSRLLQGYTSLQKGEWAPRTFARRDSRDSVEFALSHTSKWFTRRYRVRLLDTSGEELFNAADPEYHYGKHRGAGQSFEEEVVQCSGLALFFDVTSDQSRFPLDPFYANIVGILGAGKSYSRYRGPLAVVLTKCDLRPDLLISQDNAQSFFINEYPLTHSQIRHRSSSFAIFPTSAVGNLDERRNPAKLEPRGVWEPILWLLEGHKKRKTPNLRSQADV